MVRIGLWLLPLAFLVCLPWCARAETFDDRVDVARQAEDDPSVHFYQKIMFDKVGRDIATLMSICWGKDKSVEPRKFTLVADISQSGQAFDIEVRPEMENPQCFAKGISTLVFPAPPPFRDRVGFPFFFAVTVTH